VVKDASAFLRSSGFFAETTSLVAAITIAIKTRKYPTYFNISRKTPPFHFGKKSASIFSLISLSLLTDSILKTLSVH
jgi:hypothetical protein